MSSVNHLKSHKQTTCRVVVKFQNQKNLHQKENTTAGIDVVVCASTMDAVKIANVLVIVVVTFVRQWFSLIANQRRQHLKRGQDIYFNVHQQN